MKHRPFRLHSWFFKWRYLFSEEFVALLLALFIFVAPVSALALRLTDRGLFMQSSLPGATTSYTVSFQYSSPEAVGSVDMLFCVDPIPYMPCVTPPGLDVSHAVLSSQSGETGFSIGSQSTNHIVLTRSPTPITTSGQSSYTFTGIVNPTDTSTAFAIRLKTLASTDGSGSQIDFGSVRGQVTNAIVIQTQVPPMLIFCAAQEVDLGCGHTNDTYYSNMGTLSDTTPLVAQSQMAVGTNASGGFAITVSGTSLAAGTNVIAPLTSPSASDPGTNQFGINLAANTDPAIGSNPEGTFANAMPSADYAQANKYKFVSGDVIAYSPNVSLMKKFTVSYLVNSSKDLRAGVYTTTVTYTASGRF